MAFTTYIDREEYFGRLKVVIGRWDTDTTGGDIVTGLRIVYACFLQQNKAAVIANAAVCNETFPLSGGDVTIVVDSGEDGSFMAIGFA